MLLRRGQEPNSCHSSTGRADAGSGQQSLGDLSAFLKHPSLITFFGLKTQFWDGAVSTGPSKGNQLLSVPPRHGFSKLVPPSKSLLNVPILSSRAKGCKDMSVTV